MWLNVKGAMNMLRQTTILTLGLIGLSAMISPAPALAQTAAPSAPPAMSHAAPPAALSARNVLDKDMSTLLQWFPGRYDNDLQVYFDGELNTPQENRNGRIHSIFAPVALPAFGPNVFYVEQYADGDPTKIYRQRIYRFSPDYTENAIKLEIFAPSPEQATAMRGAYNDPSKLAALTPATMTLYPDCDVFWRRQENQFIGYMKPNACRVASRRSGKTLVITDNLVLTDHSIWIADQAVDETGAYVYGNRAGISHHLNKARPFTCWTSVLRGASHGTTGVGIPESWTFDRGWIHDQGGELAVKTDETPAREFYIRLRNVEWPYGTNRPSLTMYIHEKGNPRAISYSWADEGATRVGINLRWIQASCTLAGPERTFK
jgi:CpeT/CpcT family (DUF1001)